MAKKISSILSVSIPNNLSATNLAGGTAGSIPFQSAVGVTTFNAAGDAGVKLTSTGTGAPVWATPIISYLIVAGGGGSSLNWGGGGGGGGVLVGSTTMASGTTFSVVVGASGAAYAKGSDSALNILTAIGGGRGGDGGAGVATVGGKSG